MFCLPENLVSTDRCEVSYNLDIGRWTFECPTTSWIFILRNIYKFKISTAAAKSGPLRHNETQQN